MFMVEGCGIPHTLPPGLVWDQLINNLGVGQIESWRMWLRSVTTIGAPRPLLHAHTRGLIYMFPVPSSQLPPEESFRRESTGCVSSAALGTK